MIFQDSQTGITWMQEGDIRLQVDPSLLKMPLDDECAAKIAAISQRVKGTIETVRAEFLAQVQGRMATELNAAEKEIRALIAEAIKPKGKE